MPVTRTSLIAPSVRDVVPAVPTVTWTSPGGGTVLTMSDFGGNDWGITVLPGAVGFGMPEFNFYETSSPSFDGSIVRGVRASAREVSLPILLWGANRAQCLENFRGLIAAMNPRNGAGTLTVTSPDGSSSRSIAAYYSGGLQGKDDDVENGLTYMTAVIVLHCPSPFWLGDPSVTRLQVAYAGTFFPLLPVQLVANQLLGAVTLTNDGDAEAFPIYTVTGPVTNPAWTNSTNGTFLTLSSTLIAGDVVVVDTREGIKTVTKGATNLYGSLASGSSLAPLQPGDNVMSFTVSGATTATSVVISYQKRYLTAY
jgi:hypothetical protein